MPILVTGGAGYIGSHVVKYLQDFGEDIIVVDNLKTGYKESIDVEHFYRTDIRDSDEVIRIIKKHKIDSVIHFAASSLVGESMYKPYEYYNNNVYGTLCLLEAMNVTGVNKIVFSSTAAVYGDPEGTPIVEDSITEPTNPYGETKLAMEKMMKWFESAYGINYVSLRYFNAAGADKDGNIGEDHVPETHLIPLVLQVPLGKRDKIDIYGDDYDTADGTCIRDYIHVLDLAQAHYKALQWLRENSSSEIFNLGNGNGYSVNEVIRTARKVTGHPIPAIVAPRRPGDPAILVASSKKAQDILGWKPQYDSLETIIEDAWNWHRKNRDGFGRKI